MKIAVYAIAKNEEQHVDRWAASAQDADYICLLDTGSTDLTVDKARTLGVRVRSQTFEPWRFDYARNASLKLVPQDADLCIALDLDEVLVPGWRDELESLPTEVTRPRYEYTWSWKDDGSPGLVYGGDKIHARHGYRWKHPVHEVLTPDGIVEVQHWCSLKIHHHPDPTKSRGQYFPLLEQAVAEDPDDDRNAHYLAREYYFHGFHDKAKDEFLRHLSLPRAVWKPERAQSMRYLAKCDPDNAESWLLRAAAETPDRREPWVDLAMLYYQRRDWSSCYASSLRALRVTERPLEYLCDEHAWGAAPHDLAAISAWNLGLDAVAHGESALEHSPDDHRLRSNLTFYRGRS